jgi:hypothetical protein
MGRQFCKYRKSEGQYCNVIQVEGATMKYCSYSTQYVATVHCSTTNSYSSQLASSSTRVCKV